MKFFRVASPYAGYADATYGAPPSVAPRVDASRSHDLEAHDLRWNRQVPTLTIEWEPGSDEVGEFVWCLDDVLMQAPAAALLLGDFSGAESRPVEMVQDPKLRPPKRITKATKRRIWLPYEGPAIVELRVTRWVGIDWTASSTRITDVCSCGFRRWDPVGHEHDEIVRVAPDHSVSQLVPRDPAAGLKILADDLEGDSIFRIEGYHGNWLMVTEPVKDFIDSKEWRNARFYEMGDII